MDTTYSGIGPFPSVSYSTTTGGPITVISHTIKASTMGFKWERKGKSSKHIPFDWSGP